VAQGLLTKHRVTSGGAASSRAAWREIMENIGLFTCFPLFLSFAGGTPALPVGSRFPVRFSSAARLGRRTLKKLSNVVQVVSFPFSFVPFAAGIPSAKNFSNHWKT
jgi:hypothetical protein